MARKHQRVKVGPGKGRVRTRGRCLKITVSFEERVSKPVWDFFNHWCDFIIDESPRVDKALSEVSEEKDHTIAGEEKPLCVIGDPINFQTAALYHSRLIATTIIYKF